MAPETSSEEDRTARFRAEAADIIFGGEAAAESELPNSRLMQAAALLWEGYP